jgi:hypothetical protein
MKTLEDKRVDVLAAIKPICETFNITDFDYEIHDEDQTEILRIGSTKIGCSCNSILAITDELVGYIFWYRWERNRGLSLYDSKIKKVIQRYWL